MVSVHGSDMQYGFPVNEFVTDYIKLPTIDLTLNGTSVKGMART